MNQELVEAAARNHVEWFTENARVMGGEARCENGVTRIFSPASNPSEGGEVILAFPQMKSIDAGVAIEEALSIARQKRVGQVSCWSVLPTEPSDLAAMLLARGFGWGWQPHWMALDLEQMPTASFPTHDGLEIVLDEENNGGDWDVADLPHYNRADATRLQAHARRTPRRTYHFAARLGGKIVGHSLLHVDSFGVAGLYNVGVVPSARNQGIGRAISLAACEYARTLGCRHVLLNAATHIYDKLGFVSLGHGQTWWLFPPTLHAPPPAPSVVAFTEAIGRGDVGSLGDGVLAKIGDLDAPLLCKMTPLEVAAKLGQPGAAQWLLDAGASPDIIPLCDLGWRDRVPNLLMNRPDLASRRLGEWGQTPLHEAVSRNDIALVELLLSTNPDLDILEIKDTQFHATPLGWAEHLGRTEITTLLKGYTQ
jgi:GNAT superfamily N-acetyltransferase